MALFAEGKGRPRLCGLRERKKMVGVAGSCLDRPAAISPNCVEESELILSPSRVRGVLWGTLALALCRGALTLHLSAWRAEGAET